MRCTLLTDLFLILIADSVYDSRSRSLLFRVGLHLSLSWWDIIVFEGRIVETVSTGEGVSGEGQAEGEDSGEAKVL
ncbi:membrane protein [Lentinula edodes]|uniref:Membrane protein n=1 Tax=Lentinula edodes TaxID=5353 RepID=A0A1Q3EBN6_LENED|nr:membrane protein [Lentinula edodes]